MGVGIGCGIRSGCNMVLELGVVGGAPCDLRLVYRPQVTDTVETVQFSASHVQGGIFLITLLHHSNK